MITDENRDEVVTFLRCVAFNLEHSGGFFVATKFGLDADDKLCDAAWSAYDAIGKLGFAPRPYVGAGEADWRAYQRDRALNAALLVEEGAL